eukprot:m.339713 g.339713  ORF g.339713 m.339713 type:complete len:55 (-) comp20585_c0_seq12:259-423(-)
MCVTADTHTDSTQTPQHRPPLLLPCVRIMGACKVCADHLARCSTRTLLIWFYIT